MTRLLVTESELQKSKKPGRVGGVRVVVTDDFKFLIRIEKIRGAKNLTPWLRRRHAVPIELPLRITESSERILKHDDFFQLSERARTRQKHAAVQVRLHAAGETVVVHAEFAGRVASQVVRTSGELAELLHRLKRRYRPLSLTLIGHDLQLIKTLSTIIPETPVFFEREGLHDLRQKEIPLRSVLVLTNLAGAPLVELENNLPFWSKGISGFRFRHVFGQLTSKRVESTLFTREWDVIIYRGHAALDSGSIAWQLSDGPWRLPARICALYLHSACLAAAEQLALTLMPAAATMTPFRYLPDFDDSRFVRLFLERYKISRSIAAAARSIQAEFPQFVAVFAG